MDLEREIQIIALDIQQGKTDFVKGTKRILSLLSVVGRSGRFNAPQRFGYEAFEERK